MTNMVQTPTQDNCNPDPVKRVAYIADPLNPVRTSTLNRVVNALTTTHATIMQGLVNEDDPDRTNPDHVGWVWQSGVWEAWFTDSKPTDLTPLQTQTECNLQLAVDDVLQYLRNPYFKYDMGSVMAGWLTAMLTNPEDPYNPNPNLEQFEVEDAWSSRVVHVLFEYAWSTRPDPSGLDDRTRSRMTELTHRVWQHAKGFNEPHDPYSDGTEWVKPDPTDRISLTHKGWSA